MDFVRRKISKKMIATSGPALVNGKMATVPTAYYVDMT